MLFLNTEKKEERKKKQKTSSLPQSYFSRKGFLEYSASSRLPAAVWGESAAFGTALAEERGLAGLSCVELSARTVCFLLLLLLL